MASSYPGGYQVMGLSKTVRQRMLKKFTGERTDQEENLKQSSPPQMCLHCTQGARKGKVSPEILVPGSYVSSGTPETWWSGLVWQRQS